jgi:hypothetical protein
MRPSFCAADDVIMDRSQVVFEYFFNYRNIISIARRNL